LLLAISGATYAAMTAIRNHLHDNVKNADKQSANYCITIEKSSQGPNRTNGLQKYARVRFWLSVWNWSLGIPIAVFTVVVFVLAILVIWKDVCDQVSPTSWCIFRCLIAGLVLLDAICIGAVLLAYNRMKANLRDLAFNYEAAGPKDELEPPASS